MALLFDSESEKNDIKIFLDMDEVLTDFIGACEQVGTNMMFLYETEKDCFWNRIFEKGVSFWSEMPWKSGGKELYTYLSDRDCHPVILSGLPGPKRGKLVSYARKGKRAWLGRELGENYAKEAILCFRREKALYSGPSRVLIDDNKENINAWEEAGGIGLLHRRTDMTIRNLNEILANGY